MPTRLSARERTGDFLLDDDEAVSFLHEPLFAGNETTRATIVAAIALVLRHPDQMTLLRQNWALLDNAVEETLRYHLTGAAIWRIAARDTWIGDIEQPAGAILNLRMDSANRDASVFADPDRFDITRKGSESASRLSVMGCTTAWATFSPNARPGRARPGDRTAQGSGAGA
ncbi:MAG: cytochrome P450 [Sphingomonadales bacterium]|nr:cytochrome P450 [Sphingomonadales bacterium]